MDLFCGRHAGRDDVLGEFLEFVGRHQALVHQAPILHRHQDFHGLFVDESLLKGSTIDVDTNNHVVTLKGSVRSNTARARAVAIARGTEGVARVVDELVVTGA